MSGKDAEPAGYRMADISIDVGTRQVRRGDTLLQLPGLTFDLLLALVRRAPNVVASDELMNEVWAGRVVNDETVAKRVELVRDALGDDSREARYIAVVRGRGYRVIAAVEALNERGAVASQPATMIAPQSLRRMLSLALLTLLVAVAAGVWWLWSRDAVQSFANSPTRNTSRPSLAVLPLDNLSSGDSGAYFTDGMHDALIADLSRASGIKVISRTSTLPYRDSGKTLSVIARELGVDLVMEGSVLRADDRVRITVQLLDASDTHLWAEHYEGDLRDVLKLQSEVARSVAQAVKVKLSPLENSRLTAQRPVNVESYELYLKGKEMVESPRPDGFDAGVALLTRAAEIDPTSALPYARLALAYSLRAHAPGAAKSLYPRATAYALQAIGLDENLADGHEALAEMRLYYHWDWKGAEQSFRKVFELAPSLAPAHAHYGWLRVLHDDHPGAVAELRLASELDPHDPLWPSWLAWVQMLSGDYTAAEKELRGVLQKHPNFPVAYHVLGQTLLRLQRNEDAIAAFRKAGEVSSLWSWGLGQGLAAAGRKDEARALARELEKAAAPDAWGLAEIYSATGDLEQAVHWIEQGYEARRDWMPWIEANTFYAPIHDHPRFREIVRRLDLPE
ncbi:MAG TPA: tetratricopeptide repeat protein [Steroidobacteraceae bacterium]|nr:tetratricopeptide repeat protein [Steroidobacteraceae bacterium]